ncbi:hypothetical protein DVG80_04675 [Rhodococcus erythropolis]|nr:hypothetical protein DVG80_04675 [Rhodococcus erythropolis]
MRAIQEKSHVRVWLINSWTPHLVANTPKILTALLRWSRYARGSPGSRVSDEFGMFAIALFAPWCVLADGLIKPARLITFILEPQGNVL